MAVSVAQRVQYAWDAGFRNTATIESLTIIVAVSLCECGVGSSSGCETGCVQDCCPVAPSCGVLQVYQPAHPNTATCASDPACCFRLGWEISNHGTSFSPWSTYNDGCFRQYLTTVRAAIAAMSTTKPPAPAPCPSGWSLGSDGLCHPTSPAPSPTPATPPAPSPSAPSVGAAALLLVSAVAIGGWWWERRDPGALRHLEERVAGSPASPQLFAARGGRVARR